MKKSFVLFAVALAALPLVVGCQQQPQGSTPNLAIMVESNIVEAGSSFMVSGSSFKPHQKVWVDIELRGRSKWVGGMQAYCEADENGSIHPVIDIPEDTVPGDYEVKISIGKHLNDRQLLTTLPIHIQARAE